MISLSPVDAITWRSVPASEFVAKHWEGTYVVYHRPSGKTHFLNDSMFDLLDKVLREPRAVDSAIEGLAILHRGGPGLLMRDHVLELLVHLEQLGLVYRA